MLSGDRTHAISDSSSLRRGFCPSGRIVFTSGPPASSHRAPKQTWTLTADPSGHRQGWTGTRVHVPCDALGQARVKNNNNRTTTVRNKTNRTWVQKCERTQVLSRWALHTEIHANQRGSGEVEALWLLAHTEHMAPEHLRQRQ